MPETRKTEEDLALVSTPKFSVASQNLALDTTMLNSLKEQYVNLMNMKAKLEGKLAEIAQSLCGLEEEMGKLKSIVEVPQLIMGSTTPPLGADREAKETEKSNKTAAVISDKEEKDSSAEGKNPALPRKRRNALAITEDKAAKIESMKSGFRICKPQGTFLWPNMGLFRQDVVPIDNLFAIPTPPCVCSSTTTAPRLVPSPQEHRPQPISTVKPLAEKRSTVAVNFTATSVSRHLPPLPLEATIAQYANNSITSNTSTTTTRTPLINLNEVPGNPHDHGFCSLQSQSHTSPCSLNYQRRNHMTTSTSMPRMITARKENEMSQWDRGNRQHLRVHSSLSSHRVKVGAGTWLALCTPNSSMGNNPRRV
ncbi:protein DYAD-like [Durio zibethinus]|uniref:Protein DYAD-like n=1 Tax=Durio zibethinus TaxID=66656 RepID=A0A6P5ZTL6_DURZI|nr:protein DYAD-like [Durio zibethinus]